MSSDKFVCCDISTLLKWILAEEATGRIFGICRDLFFVPGKSDPFRMQRYGKTLETPLGVAAGPHTQLAQNIISAWLTGARYMELKTIQVLDELSVTKPCIDMTDEGYNCEWSQELTLSRSFDEYLNAWILLHILKDRFNWGNPREQGFIFNMSVGYNMEGILSPTVQHFLDKMADCSAEKTKKIERLARFYPRIRKLEIPNCISDNITISTMHGCPPDEVEKIGRYFVSDRKLNTTIKLNPTLLGPDRLRGILNDQLGFQTTVPDEAFAHDLTYTDGVALIRNLQREACKDSVNFGIKLTNTLETLNEKQNLPKSEPMVYMSGRALHAISINLASRLQAEFQGVLDISFSAGVDCYNFADVIACNLKPVTVCSDILKPGGYGRLSQYLEKLSRAYAGAGAASLDDFIRAKNGKPVNVAKAALENLSIYAQAVLDNPAYHKRRFPFENIKTHLPLNTFDCITAPCMTTCPVSQDIPAYMYHTARGDYETALAVIMADNPLPNIQGMACDHLCQEKCTRIHYDDPLRIREVKRFVAETVAGSVRLTPASPNGIRVAIVGGGPSGLSCGHFLALDGFEVHVFESRSFAGGWAADAIPAFRLDEAGIKKDIDAILSLGITMHYETPIDRNRFEALRRDFNYLYIGVGAQEGTALGVAGEDAAGIWDHLRFLSAVRQGQRPDLGRTVAVFGGGNSAMDAARTAKRLVGPAGKVSVLYRRTRREMPAAPEEIQSLLDEGIDLLELTAPECLLVADGRVRANRCFRMTLGEKDAGGRPAPIKIDGSEFELKVDSVISAIGQRVNLDFFPHDKLEIHPDTRETQVENVFAGGDAVHGAATLIKAIGDGKKAAASIRRRALAGAWTLAVNHVTPRNAAELEKRRARRETGVRIPEIEIDRRLNFDMVIETLDVSAAKKEASRCLQCDQLCDICVTVCPNRANMSYSLSPTVFTAQKARRVGDKVEIRNFETIHLKQRHQVLNIGDYCNECGNCTTFCPTSGVPYRDKPRFHVSRKSFSASDRGYYLSHPMRLESRQDGRHALLECTSDGFTYENEDVQVRINDDHCAVHVEFKKAGCTTIDLKQPVIMSILYQAIRHLPPLSFDGACPQTEDET
ncbi:MAG: putative selenate reductase subunit YgfK [Deltaproteobacteria bacterium]|nr:putative selenate reductase subunit YgfK [Deltaproteobacteria bacterium]